MLRAASALIALCLAVGCQDNAKQIAAAKDLASDRATLECEARFANTSCETAEFADEVTCVSTLTERHRDNNDKFFDAGASYHGNCASNGLESWPFTGRCQDICAVFTGSAAETEDCDPDEGILCEQGLLCNDGTCTNSRNLIAADGEPCAGGQNRVCATGLACSADGVCVAAPAIGQACLLTAGEPAICDTTHYCDDNGLCQETRAAGLPCTRAAMCETFNCATGQCAPSAIEPLSCWGNGSLYACG
ncbi:MAG: hypothetical protein JKY37_17860 [Nannocystaceae bacterium]|nr:hypothetical protein [Nannocystaceae bacterium]